MDKLNKQARKVTTAMVHSCCSVIAAIATLLLSALGIPAAASQPAELGRGSWRQCWMEQNCHHLLLYWEPDQVPYLVSF